MTFFSKKTFAVVKRLGRYLGCYQKTCFFQTVCASPKQVNKYPLWMSPERKFQILRAANVLHFNTFILEFPSFFSILFSHEKSGSFVFLKQRKICQLELSVSFHGTEKLFLTKPQNPISNDAHTLS